ncbi:hypothetical protein LOTGIDRAFT_231414 [Lottia gigantea]|uniref:FAM69 protein-kinase domain-containing protein n=1 Tax=Lottia gigantea TaxID=225164 RepID=V4AXP3_LOTGI|nr:hypothetical protein LOTGIDRAFT_231414 [Lottia gigantea]ESO98351.1 hypothetical protein LOTGIDRAFT_231414 [Lottia gigantea]
MYVKCSDEVAKERIQKTCDLYKEGLILGDLCPALCEQQTIRYKTCTNHKGGKISLLMDCDGFCSSGKTVPAMLKSTVAAYHDTVRHSMSLLSDTVPWKNIKDLTDGVKQSIETALGPNNSSYSTEDIIKRVFYESYEHFNTSATDQLDKAFILSVWSLVQQDEYLITKLNQHSPLFPKMYHSCGSFYLLESAPPGDILNPPLNPLLPERSTWKERVNVAIRVLDAVRVLDNNFHQTLHMCDVKGENFGLTPEGQLKLIDPDDMFFTTRLENKLKGKGQCQTDHDCNIICECHGVCLKGKCHVSLKNNNLQSVCKMVLKSRTTIMDLGVLRKAPAFIKQRLQDMIEICINSREYKEKPNEEIRLKLRKILLSSI